MENSQRFFLCLLILITLNSQIFSQTAERKKPKIKDFGSSLKRTPQENLSSKKKNSGANNDGETIRIETNLVVFDFLVLSQKGLAVTNLKKEDFVVIEDDQPQEIQDLTTGNDENIPRSIVLVIDYSGSQALYLERSIKAAKLLVDKLRPNDLMAIVTDDVEVIAGYTNDKKKLKDKLDSLKPNINIYSPGVPFSLPNFSAKKPGKSQQYGAIYSVLNEMFDEEDVRPIVIFQTDGDQLIYLKGQCKSEIFCPSSENKLTNFSLDDLLTMTDKARATIYTVVPGTNHLGLSPEKKEERTKAEEISRLKAFGFDPTKNPPSRKQLEEIKKMEELKKIYYPNGLPDPQEALAYLSKYSGGWIDFLEKPEQADEIYSKILNQIELRYVVSYSPKNEAKDGKRRVVKVSVKNHPEYIV